MSARRQKASVGLIQPSYTRILLTQFLRLVTGQSRVHIFKHGDVVVINKVQSIKTCSANFEFFNKIVLDSKSVQVIKPKLMLFSVEPLKWKFNRRKHLIKKLHRKIHSSSIRYLRIQRIQTGNADHNSTTLWCSINPQFRCKSSLCQRDPFLNDQKIRL